MKELYSTRKYSLGVYDDKNFYVGVLGVRKGGRDKGKRDMRDLHYFSDLVNAAKWLADRCGRKAATDLKSYIVEVGKERRKIEEALAV